MIVCDWCRQPSHSMYNTWVQKSDKYGDGETIQLCSHCLTILEEEEAKHLHIAVQTAKEKCQQE